MSALSPEADMLIVGINVCLVPKADFSVENSMAVNFSPRRWGRSPQHRAASRSQFFALIQAMIFQMSSSVAMISP